MKTLSEFLTKYTKDHLFNGRYCIETFETFDQRLTRVLKEGIFKYRKMIASSAKSIGPGSPAAGLCNALIDVENESTEL